MLKNCKGFSLMEVMVAISIMTLFLTAFMPLSSKLYREEKAAYEEEKGLRLLTNHLNQWVIDASQPSIQKVDNVEYHLNWQENAYDGSEKLCINWVGKNERAYTICGEAKPLK